jgi:hypothetical protein
MVTKFATLAAMSALSSLVAGAAIAGDNWPGSVVGTWDGEFDNVAVTMTISSQASSGLCRPISGNIVDNDTGESTDLIGFYCPETGRIHFTRTFANGFTFQDYSGNVSDKGGSTIYVGGVLADVNVDNHPPTVGEYSFLAHLVLDHPRGHGLDPPDSGTPHR